MLNEGEMRDALVGLVVYLALSSPVLSSLVPSCALDQNPNAMLSPYHFSRFRFSFPWPDFVFFDVLLFAHILVAFMVDSSSERHGIPCPGPVDICYFAF